MKYWKMAVLYNDGIWDTLITEANSEKEAKGNIQKRQGHLCHDGIAYIFVIKQKKEE